MQTDKLSGPARAVRDFLAPKLRIQLILLVLFSALPLMGLLVLNVKERYEDALGDALDNVAAVSHQIRFRVDSYLALAESTLRIAETALSPNLSDVSGNDERLKSVYRKNPNIFEGIWVKTDDGRLLNSLVVAPANRGAFTAVNRNYVEQAISRGELVIDEPILSNTTRRWIVAMAYPIANVGGKARAVVAGSIDLERFQELLSAEGLPAGSVVMVVSRQGVVIADNSLRWIGKDVRSVPWIEHALKDREDKEELVFPDGTRHIAAYTTAARAPWLVYVGIPTELALRPGRIALRRLLAISLLVLTAAMALAWLLSGLITRPVRQLGLDIDRLAAGDLSHRSAIETKNEVGSLARGFNAMAAALEGRTQALQENLRRIQALHDIDKAITSTIDLKAVLEILLDKIQTLCPFAAASGVRLWDNESEKLIPLATRNIPLEEWKSALAQAKSFVSRELIHNKAPLVIRNMLSDPRISLKDFLRKYDLASLVAVPLIAREKLIGSLAIYTRGDREFTREEIDFLATLAGQAAVAIHNARLYEEMLKANRTKDEFLSVMSHELRTPLSVITGYVGLLKDRMMGEINPQQEEALDKVLARAHDQLGMINNILFATSMEAARMTTASEPVAVPDIFKELMATYNQSSSGRVALRWECDSDIPPLRSDKSKIEHILKNLINNALKFTRQGSVTVAARLAGHRWLEMEVADTGVGIEPDDLPFIFDKFRQADSSETRLFGGVGMGLYIVKCFADMLGGAVNVESEPGRGSKFTVRIPVEV